MRSARLFRRSTGWRRVLLVTTTAGISTALLCAAIALLVSGPAAAASAAVAAGGVIAFSFLSLALIDWAERHAQHLAIPLFMVGFVIKIAALAVLLPLVQPGEWLQPGWAIASGVAVFLIWQVVEILSFSQMRISVTPES